MRISSDDFVAVPYAAMHDVHLEELTIINAVYEQIEAIQNASGDKNLLSASLDALLLHTREHFANEERLMKEYSFPPYAMHKAAHDLFLAEMEQMVGDWKSTLQIEPVTRFMHINLPAWLKQHISTMDYVTAGFLAAHS